MEKKVKNQLSGSWSSDDEQLLFQFTVVFYYDVDYPQVSITILHTSRYSSNKFLLWENNNMPFYEAVAIECRPAKVQFIVVGTITCKIEKQATHNDLVIWADIKYGAHYPYNEFMGPVYFLELPKHIEPIPPFPDPDPDDEINPGYPVIYDQPHRDLFPFTYMHNWPEPTEADIELNFITYTPYAGSPPDTDFYNTLCTLKAQGDRYGMEAAAVDFINNSPAFVKNIALLQSPMDVFNSAVIITLKNKTYTDFVNLVCLEATMTKEELTEYLASQPYLETKENVWLSYFALVILPGYRNRLLNELTRTLQAGHALEKLLLNSPPEEIENPGPIHMMLMASIILPADIFSVPFSLSPPAGTTGSVDPYAIGDLQLVRQKLIRYEPGEVANIINVMPGEKKSIERRKLNQYTQKTIEGVENSDDNTDYETESNDDFEKEVSKTLADYKRTYDYTNLQSTYSPPTSVTVNGTYTIDRTGEKPETEDITTFAKKILNSTTRRVAEKVYRARYQNTRNEYEESETCEFENLTGTKNLLGIYYWLNKVYLAQVVNYGNRFILSLDIPNPAQSYIAQSYNLSGSNLQEPKAPAEFGIYTFNDITPDNYAQLCAYYKVTDITQPPAANAIVCDALVGNENKLITIPKGYTASTADITYVLSQDTNPFSVQCLLGKNQVMIDHPQSAVITLPMNNENLSVPFSASYFYTMASPPDTPPSFIISTEITCLLSAEKLNDWKISIYQKIMDGYEKLRKEYYSNFNTKNPETETANPAKNRLTVRNELKKQCIFLLMEYAGQNLDYGDKSAPTTSQNPMPDYGRFEQFFNQVFEWAEMTFTFIEDFSSVGTPAHSNITTALGDNFFTAFLQAKGARVYLPAIPAFNYRMVFFLATGAIWTADEHLAPLLSSQTSLVNELKKVFNHPQPRFEKVLETWEIFIPTSLQVLNNTKIQVI